MNIIIRLSFSIIFFVFLTTNLFAQSSAKFTTKIIKLSTPADNVRVNFQSDSVRLSFSRKELINYIVNDLKKPKSQIRELEAKKILLDSLMKGTVRINMLPTFAAQYLKNDLQAAMFDIAPALLKRGHAEIEKNKERVTNITYKVIPGSYGSEDEVFYIKKQQFYYYVVKIGE